MIMLSLNAIAIISAVANFVQEAFMVYNGLILALKKLQFSTIEKL